MATARDDLQEVTGRAPRRRGPPAGQRGQAAADLEQLGKQAGLFGLGFAPGAGMADYFGQFPSAQGGTEPSAVENFQQGNYGTAAMQGLGAMGDLALTVPVAGAAIGSVMKAPRAAQRMLNAMPKVDNLGFYSQAEKALMDIPQQKGTGQQYLAQIQKTPGVRQEELQYTGLDEFLASKPTVTKAEIQDYLDTNKVQLQEVTLGSPQSIANRDEAIASRYGYEAIVEFGGVAFFDPKLDDFVEFRDLPAAMRAEISNPQTEFGGFAKFGPYTLPGGENYREVLLTMPVKNPLTEYVNYRDELFEKYGKSFYSTEATNEELEKLASLSEATSKVDPQYRSSHFDQPNVLAHMRLNDRVIDGKPTLFVEEIQSDWHQAGRSKGYNPRVKEQRKATTAKMMEGYWEVRDQNGEFITNVIDKRQDEASALSTANARIAENNPIQIASSNRVPDAPFKTTWDDLALKRAIKIASDEGYDKIAFTTGKTQAERYDLSKQISQIRAQRLGDKYQLVVLDNKESTIYNGYLQPRISAEEMEDLVGKEMANKIVKDASPLEQDRKLNVYSGLDLQVGGEGMKGFYDKMLPKKLEKLGKQYGVKVEKTLMPTERVPMEGGVPSMYPEKVEVWSMDVPAEMKEKVSTQGQPLFQIGAGAAGTAGIMGLSAGEENQGAQ